MKRLLIGTLLGTSLLLAGCGTEEPKTPEEITASLQEVFGDYGEVRQWNTDNWIVEPTGFDPLMTSTHLSDLELTYSIFGDAVDVEDLQNQVSFFEETMIEAYDEILSSFEGKSLGLVGQTADGIGLFLHVEGGEVTFNMFEEGGES